MDTRKPDKTRRSFFWKLGAGASGALAATAGLARPASQESDDLSQQVARLEDEKTLRKLHRDFEQALDDRRYDDVVELFADDAEVLFDGDVFSDRTDGVSRLYRDRFRAGKSGRRMEPAPGFEVAADEQHDRVEVSGDRLSATAIFPYSIQVGRPIESESSLVSMARLHGEGVETWWEGGVYNVVYGRDTADRRWKIRKLEYKTLSRADYRPGRSYARPLSF
jgi:hypothetical protein